jgi:hypothetical protein
MENVGILNVRGSFLSGTIVAFFRGRTFRSMNNIVRRRRRRRRRGINTIFGSDILPTGSLLCEDKVVAQSSV